MNTERADRMDMWEVFADPYWKHAAQDVVDNFAEFNQRLKECGYEDQITSMQDLIAWGIVPAPRPVSQRRLRVFQTANRLRAVVAANADPPDTMYGILDPMLAKDIQALCDYVHPAPSSVPRGAVADCAQPGPAVDETKRCRRMVEIVREVHAPTNDAAEYIDIETTRASALNMAVSGRPMWP